MAQKEAAKYNKPDNSTKSQSQDVIEKQADTDLSKSADESGAPKEKPCDDVKEPKLEKKQCIE